MLLVWLLLGVVSAIPYVWAAQRTNENRLFAMGLLVAALIYVVFAWMGDANTDWRWIEFLGVGIYGLCALLGLIWSPWWLTLGWLLHPLWDVCLHLLNVGAEFTPEWYVLICIGFDVWVGLSIALRQLDRMGRRNSKVLHE